MSGIDGKFFSIEVSPCPDLISLLGCSMLGADTSEAIAELVSKIAETGEGELSVPAMKKYIQYAKAKCAPRLTEETGNQLASKYVQIREGVRKRNYDVS